MKIIKIISFAIMLILASCLSSDSSIYIDPNELNTEYDSFRIHTGNNIWIETHTVHRDATGLFTFQSNLRLNKDPLVGFEKSWRCPYCHHYWPIGVACQNKDCASKYK